MRYRHRRPIVASQANDDAKEWVDNWRTKQVRQAAGCTKERRLQTTGTCFWFARAASLPHAAALSLVPTTPLDRQAAVSNRASWFPGTQLPEHLDGTMVGDYGFDPLSLVRREGWGLGVGVGAWLLHFWIRRPHAAGRTRCAATDVFDAPPHTHTNTRTCTSPYQGVDKSKLKWYQQAELVHARFAMLGVAGILVPDLFHSIGAGGPAAQIPWFDHAKFEYYAPIKALFGAQMLLFAWVELRRLQDIRNPGSVNQDPIFSQYRCAAGRVGGGAAAACNLKRAPA